MFDKKAVHFGSGAIGRGFVGEFLHQSGYEVVFVDVSDTVIDQLNEKGSYTVFEIGKDGERQIRVDHFRAINSRSHADDVVREIATADVVTCAVGPRVLPFLAGVIAKGIEARESTLGPMAVIACENAINATDELATYIRDKLSAEAVDTLATKARFANSAVDRIVPQRDAAVGLDVWIEEFYEWCVETKSFDGIGNPPIEAIHFVPDLAPYIERKLFTVNTGHATSAYFGHAAGKRLVHEAMADDRILDAVRGCLGETANLIVKKFGIDAAEQQAYVDRILTRISNPALEDPVTRVARAPLRKLSRKERFINPASQLAEMGEPCQHLLAAIDLAFRFTGVDGDEESVRLREILAEASAEQVVEQVCGLTAADKLYRAVVRIVERVQKGEPALAEQSAAKRADFIRAEM